MASKVRTLPVKNSKAELLKKIAQNSLENGKGLDVAVIDVRGKSDVADYLIIATGTSSRHVGALAEQVVQKISESNLTTVATEGMGQCNWVIVDTPYIIVHVFLPEMRSMYNLEKMWSADFGGSKALQL